MYCPKCGTENPEGAKICRSCSWVLTSVSAVVPSTDTKTSGLAITSLVLGILSIFTFFLTAIPAIILGIISIIKIEKSGGKLTGMGFAIAGIVVPIVALPILMIAILMPSLNRAKQQAMAITCMTKQKQWGIIFSLYTTDNDGYFCENMNWPDTLRPIYKDAELLLCPMATKSLDEGGRMPFAAWCDKDLKGSYGMNFWVLKTPEGQTIRTHKPEYFWRTTNVKSAGMVPVLLDCSSPGLFPLHSDKPPEYDGQPKSEDTNENEIRQCCINRHKGFVNCLFMDWSVRKVGLKELWGLKWHREFDLNYPAPDWPEWMKNFKDYTKEK